MKRIHVFAGILRDAHGRVLLAQRGAGKHLEGLWEFPGGKVERDEAPLAALRRELHEEIGVDVDAAEPFLTVPWTYPEQHVELEVWDVTAWRGEPHGREGQAIAWCAPDAMPAYPMPPADAPLVAALRLPRTMLVTPASIERPDAYLAQLARAVAGGVRGVQVRVAATQPGRAALVERIVEVAKGGGAVVVVNGDVAAAERLESGVHLGAAAAGRLRARPVSRTTWFGVSAHDAAELAQARRLEADYVVVGPVAATPTHPGAPALGWTRFASLVRAAGLPCYAIGGLRPDDLAEARMHGAFGVAGIRAFHAC